MQPPKIITPVTAKSIPIFLFIIFLAVSVVPLRADPLFNDSGQALGNETTYAAALADLNGDMALDVVTANGSGGRLWINSGNGAFSAGQVIGIADGRGVAVADLNGDTTIDAFVANFDSDNAVWLNDGNAVFTQSTQSMNPAAASLDVALGDLDGDLDLDAFLANEGANEVWQNGGTAVFSATQTLAGSASSRKVVLGDVDGDTDLDAYVANGNTSAQADELWFNNGLGIFSAAGQSLDSGWNEGAALADLDGDNDLDLFLADWTSSDAVWINQGGAQGGTTGNFSDSGQSLSGSGSLDVILLDVDGDTDLDAIVAKWTPDATELWLNNGSGSFTLSAESLDGGATYAVVAGDLDGDNDNDLFFANFGANHLWLKGGFGLPVAWFNLDARANLAGQISYPWVQQGAADLPVSLSFPPAAAVEVSAQVATDNGTTMQQIPFTAGQQNGNLLVSNPQPTVSDAMTLTLTTAAARPLVATEFVNPLHLVFINPDEGEQACILCYIDWLVQLLGFEPTFWALHHLELTALQGSLSWDYYSQQFQIYNGEMAEIIATHPLLLWQTFDALETWTPAMEAVDNGQGGSFTVTQDMVDEAMAALTGIRNEAGPQLAEILQTELDLLEPDTLVGLSMDAALARVEARVQSRQFLPLVFQDQ